MKITISLEAYDWSTTQKAKNTSSSDLGNEPKEIGEVSKAYVYKANLVIPNSYEVQTSPQKAEWNEAIKDELSMMEKRDVWQEVQKLPEKRAMGTKWVFEAKEDDEGKVRKYKTRLVAQGQYQRYGIDYQETYSPVINFELARLFIVILIVILGWRHRQLGVTGAYLYGPLKEETYINIPKGYKVTDERKNNTLKITQSAIRYPPEWESMEPRTKEASIEAGVQTVEINELCL